MRIVIDISETMIEAAKTDMWCGSPSVGYAIKNGTPYEARPQGEWVIEEDAGGRFIKRCTRCGHTSNLNGDVKNFCQKCGADMREGEVERRRVNENR